jgi:TonB family protein
MTRRLSAWLLVSVVAHAALVVAVLALLRFVPAPVLFVDLVHDLLTAVETPGAGATGRGEAGGTAGPTGARRASQLAGAHRAGDAAGHGGSRRPGAVASARSAPEPSSSRELATAPAPVAAQASAAAPPSAAAPSSPPAPSATTGPAPVAAAPPIAAPSPAGAPPSATAPAASMSSAALEVTPVAPSSVLGSDGRAPTGAAREGNSGGAVASASVGAGGSGERPGGGAGRTGGGEGGPLVLWLPGGGGDGSGEYAAYLALLRRRIAETLVFPTLARRRGLSGTAQVELEIQPSGAISQVTLVASSSHRVLDEAALDAAYGVGRVPFPAGVTPRQLRVRLPVVFDLR